VLCALAAVLVGVPLVAPVTPARAAVDYSGSWVGIADMQKARYHFGATTGACPASPEKTDPGKCVYAVGTYTYADANLMAEYYDPAFPGLGWRGLPPMVSPLGRGQAATATGNDGRVYVFGSSIDESVSVEAYDPARNIWEPVPPPLNPNRRSPAAVADAMGRIYVLGGSADYSLGSSPPPTADVEMYDPSEGPDATWKSVPAMKKARQNFAAALGSDKRIYVVGGAAARGSAERFNPGTDPANGTWEEIPSLMEQAPRRAHLCHRGQSRQRRRHPAGLPEHGERLRPRQPRSRVGDGGTHAGGYEPQGR